MAVDARQCSSLLAAQNGVAPVRVSTYSDNCVVTFDSMLLVFVSKLLSLTEGISVYKIPYWSLCFVLSIHALGVAKPEACSEPRGAGNYVRW